MSTIGSEAFTRQAITPYIIASYPDVSPSEARKTIKLLLDSVNFMVNLSTLDSSELSEVLQEAQVSSGNTQAIANAKYSGLAWALAYHDDSDNTGPIVHGQPVVFDTVTGRAVTGINENWKTDEYKIVGTAWGSHSGTGYKRIPILLTATPEQAGPRRVKFRNDNSPSETIPAYGVFEIVDTILIDDEEYLSGKKFARPTGAITKQRYTIAVNTNQDVPHGETGECYLADDDFSWPIRVIYNDSEAGGIPKFGEYWGVIRSTYTIRRGAGDFVVLGNVITENKTVSVRFKKNDSDVAVIGAAADAFACLRTVGSVDDGTFLNTTQPQFNTNSLSSTYTGNFQEPLLVNSNQPIVTGFGGGFANSGIGRPVRVLFHGYPSAFPPLGTVWGPLPFHGNIGKLYRYIPGFIAIDIPFNSGNGYEGTTWFVRQIPMLGYAKITLATHWGTGSGSTNFEIYYTTARPCDPTGTLVYDGSTSDFPAVEFNIFLNAKHRYGVHPNVRLGDVIQYRISNYAGEGGITGFGEIVAFANENYFDAALGTLMPWDTTSKPIPRGWAKANGIDNSSAVGGTNVNLVGKYVFGGSPTGVLSGASTHTHTSITVQSGTGVTVSDDVAANHHPPSVTLEWIQRIR